jgi:polygalacturonase
LKKEKGMRAAMTPLGALLFVACVKSSSAQVFNVLNYGAVGDGITDDTAPVAWTFGNASLVRFSTVVFPQKTKRGDAARFLTGPFNMSSNQLVIVAGTVLGSTNNADYRIVAPLPYYAGGQDAQGSGQPEWQSLVYAKDVSNLTITGGGLIDGQGAVWWACKNGDFAKAPCSGISRPNLLRIINGAGIKMYNVSLANSPSWTSHFANCTDVHVFGVNETAASDSPNTDGKAGVSNVICPTRSQNNARYHVFDAISASLLSC